MRIYNNFYLFLESIVSPTAVGNEKGGDGGRILGCIEGGSGESGRDGGRICGALREAVGSLERWLSAMLGETYLI
jgi:hypothetical protein